MLEEHVSANQQEKISAQTTLKELTSKAKMVLERGGEYNHFEKALEHRDGKLNLDSLGTLRATQQRAQQK